MAQDKLLKFQVRVVLTRSLGIPIGKHPGRVTTDALYVRVRQSSPTAHPAIANAALYVKVDGTGKILRDKLYMLALTPPGQPFDLRGGAWYTNAQLKAAGVPGYRLPKEPVVVVSLSQKRGPGILG